MKRTTAALSLITAMALVGANVPLGKALVAEVPVYLFALYRFFLCAVILAFLVRHEDGPRLRQMSMGQVVDVTLMSALGMVGFMVLMLEGLRRTSAVDAGVITATIPAVVALLGFIVLRDKLNRPQILAVALAVSGIAMVQGASAGQGIRSLTGNALIAAAVIGEASFVILGKRLTPAYKPLRLSLAANIAGFLLTLPLVYVDVQTFDPGSITPDVWLLGTWYVLSAGIFSLFFWYRGLPHVDTALAGLATAALPISALVVSALFLGEPIGPAQFLGAALVIFAIYAGARASR